MRIIAASLVAAGLAVAAKTTTVADLEPQRYLEHVRFLASEQLRGRASGSPELEKAGAYIARQFKRFGLQPVGGRSWQQAFPVTTNAKLGPKNAFLVRDNGKTRSLKYPGEFIPFNFSSNGKFGGALVFAGYGITAPEYNYDDYAGLDVKEKYVLLLRHEPQELDEKSVFAGKAFTSHAQFSSKVTNAKAHGAKGVILINDRATHPSESDALEPFGKAVGPRDAGVPFVQIAAEEGERWIREAGQDAAAIIGAIDKQLKPRSFAIPAKITVEGNVDLERAVKTVHNVAGYLAGETDEYVVIGAHYDHLGLGDQFSLAPSLIGTPHLGADDNASGTAGMLELARYFASRPKARRGLLFLAFAGEELGLLGSAHYVAHPEMPLDKAVAMINMDMIGRIRDGKVFIGGTGTGSTLKPLLEKTLPKYPALKVDYSDASGYGSSDHTSFTTRQVPVLFFFSGLHSDYHKPSDTWDKIDAGAATTLLTFIADIVSDLDQAAERPKYVKVAPPPQAMGGVGGGPGYGAYFGSIPDFGDIPNGVKFADVKEGSPAAKAGLKAGDILTEFDGKPVKNLYDFTYLLRAGKPGDVVAVKVLRGGAVVEAQVTLEKRR